MGEFMIVVVIGTSIWMAYDAAGNKVPVDKKPYSLNNGALAWFLGGILIWIATFPYYIYKRSQILKANESSTNPISGQAEELQKFKQLLDTGAIDQTEYENKKRQILGS